MTEGSKIQTHFIFLFFFRLLTKYYKYIKYTYFIIMLVLYREAVGVCHCVYLAQ